MTIVGKINDIPGDKAAAIPPEYLCTTINKQKAAAGILAARILKKRTSGFEHHGTTVVQSVEVCQMIVVVQDAAVVQSSPVY
ncbi:hypothetical protein [Desulfofustis glycolicus]|uniref:hypothetical protein n=1 Tax=Desulfofustis glycolicus TaxID=51195 RepID=UPI00116152FC|nr:hypothetical protein [Desulfofustis glycolicus]MCB2217371.1 hypothetical protein [Desulfobulbaceae bacterium]